MTWWGWPWIGRGYVFGMAALAAYHTTTWLLQLGRDFTCP